MGSGLPYFFEDLKTYTFWFGMYAFVIYWIEFHWFLDLRRDLQREKPEWRFRYSLWEFCLFLMPLTAMLCVVTLQAVTCIPPPDRPLATEGPAGIAAIAIHCFLASEGAMVVAKMRQIRADEKASAARVMALWCGVFFCIAVVLLHDSWMM